MLTQTITHNLVLQSTECWNCGGVYALTAHFLEKRREDGHSWNCPYCDKGTCYTKSEVEKLQLRIRVSENNLARERAEHDQTRASLRATKGAKTRLQRRLSRGICPCCEKYFKDLHSHIEAEHPDFKKDGD